MLETQKKDAIEDDKVNLQKDDDIVLSPRLEQSSAL